MLSDINKKLVQKELFESMDNTSLTDEQKQGIAVYVYHELEEAGQDTSNIQEVQERIFSTFEDIAGLETADEAEQESLATDILDIYVKRFLS